jgi:hypothetical protein
MMGICYLMPRWFVVAARVGKNAFFFPLIIDIIIAERGENIKRRTLLLNVNFPHGFTFVILSRILGAA